ncbi:hypothetical protein L596_027529 [Steinernema carpocapsae]|uniref:Fungal lipase-type domain-containing protein n=1 Tax=Steinernema carpocapsae TaxID=34508 RepID=A0A4U5LVT0_STECR|nr:hypothetical protein L596_027529 [Steinernema carpocapsae]
MRFDLRFGIFFCCLLGLGFAQAPQPKRTLYDETLARKLLNLASGAYAVSPQGCINRTFPVQARYREYTSANLLCDPYDNSCAFYTVVSDIRREIIIVFRGTKTKSQLFMEGLESDDLIQFYGHGKVNKYFFRALNTMYDNVDKALTDPQLKDYQVTFTGHSLGGALASIAALRCVLDGRRASNQVKLVTFGQPRVGNVDFAMKHDELVPYSFRVVHRLDIVPHLPACKKVRDRRNRRDDSKPCNPNSKKKAYHHGTEIWYPYGMAEGAQYFECLGEPKNEDFDCSDSLSFEFSKYDTYISDHRHYFGHRVPSFGKLGCDPHNPLEETMDIDAPLPPSAADLLTRTARLKTLREQATECGKGDRNSVGNLDPPKPTSLVFVYISR